MECTARIMKTECQYEKNRIMRQTCTKKREMNTETTCTAHSCQLRPFEQPDVIFYFPPHSEEKEQEQQEQKDPKKRKLTKIAKLILLTQSSDPEVVKEAEEKLKLVRAKNIAKKKARKERKRQISAWLNEQ